jgi:Heterokaryon incompatibility protein (HET)
MSKIYDDLDYPSQEIRVIDVLPGFRNDPIECRLQSQRLNDPSMEFEALSYEWGEPDPADSKHSILLDGTPFPIRENLWEALLNLRYRTKQRRLWIDAICIN